MASNCTLIVLAPTVTSSTDTTSLLSLGSQLYTIALLLLEPVVPVIALPGTYVCDSAPDSNISAVSYTHLRAHET